MNDIEFSRPYRLDRIGAGTTEAEITAEPGEREALARRFHLPEIGRLQAKFSLHQEVGGVRARGHIAAEVVQSCVASGEPVPASVSEPFDLRFVPEEHVATAEEEIELSGDECDIVFFSGSAIDLGEAAAETLALALDPFPRSPQAAEALKSAGVLSESEAAALAAENGPFGALGGLKDKLQGR